MPIQVFSSERTFLNETQLPVTYMRKIVQCIFAFVRFAAIPDRFKWQRCWRPCWMTGILLMVIQHGGYDVAYKRSIASKSSRQVNTSIVVLLGILLVIHRVSYLDLIFKNFVCFAESLNLQLILKYCRLFVWHYLFLKAHSFHVQGSTKGRAFFFSPNGGYMFLCPTSRAIMMWLAI